MMLRRSQRHLQHASAARVVLGIAERPCGGHGGSRASHALIAETPVRQLRRQASTQAVIPQAQWDPGSLRALLQQVARDGKLEEGLYRQLRGDQVIADAAAGFAAAAPEDDDMEGEGREGASSETLDCELEELVLTSEVCSSQRFRDFVLLAALAERVAKELPKASQELVLRAAAAYSSLGVLNTPLFHSIARTLLRMWQGAANPPVAAHIVQVARAFSSQRLRHDELFDALASQLVAGGGAKALTPDEALSLLHSLAFLRLGSEFGGQWAALEAQAVSPGLDKLGLGPLSELCYVLVLARQADARQEEMCRMLEVLAGQVLSANDTLWTSGEGPALHGRLLLLRSVARYLFRDAYRTLSADVVQAFRRIHRMEPRRKVLKPTVNFTRKLSDLLRKMKIAHLVNAESGPFVLDVVERDRKIVYECNHFDRYYAGATEKIATMCLQERVVKAMGYKIVQIPHWQWNKIKHRKQRSEYLRMSRYYAIKDSRELLPRDEVPQDVALNEFDYLGEYFFKKERPSSSWSWFQPRYDATKRLPVAASVSAGA